MNLPVGSVEKQGLKLEETDLVKKIAEYLKEKFVGYLVLTIEGFDGVEEGLLFLKNGQAIGAIYEFTKYGKIIYGEEALPVVINAGAAEKGVIDICALTSQQLDLVLAFNDKILLKKNRSAKDIHGLKPRAFDDSHAKKHLAGLLEKEASKLEILRKFGLGKI